MKRIFFFSTFIVLLCCFVQCKKEQGTPFPVPVNDSLTLYNQPLAIIQFYITSKWKLESVRGGFIANYVRNFHDENVFWQISPNRIMENYNGNIYTDTAITWIRELGIFTSGDFTFTMNFPDKRGYPYVYQVDSIVKDSLMLREFGFDGQRYYFSKAN